jgi:hypothetical protein
MDTQLRELERKALSDPEAQKRLDAARERAEIYPTVEEIKQRLDDRLQQFISEGQDLVFQLCKPILQKHKDVIEQFSWEQFTPYWCDGEPCDFSYYSFMDNEHALIHTAKYEDANAPGVPKNPWPADKKAAYEAMWKDFSKLDDELAKMSDLLKVIFGDHVQVDVDINGISTSSFKDHY